MVFCITAAGDARDISIYHIRCGKRSSSAESELDGLVVDSNICTFHFYANFQSPKPKNDLAISLWGCDSLTTELYHSNKRGSSITVTFKRTRTQLSNNMSLRQSSRSTECTDLGIRNLCRGSNDEVLQSTGDDQFHRWFWLLMVINCSMTCGRDESNPSVAKWQSIQVMT
ncbi:hypothetical protein VTL71DRAFT_8249 [Oculimacula yallundae]|uniref:Uncharacterized protein n=1 Tax=Oculimacula yallundae TaxID=86028 RepID=A0ABR4CX13_9HELO